MTSTLTSRAARRAGWLRCAAVVCAAAALVPSLTGMGVPPPNGASAGPARPLRQPPRHPVPVHVVPSRRLQVPKLRNWQRPPLAWPTPGAATVTLSGAHPTGVAVPARAPGREVSNGMMAAPTLGSARAGRLPVWVGPAAAATRHARRAAVATAPAQVQVVMAPRSAAAAAEVSGVVFTVANASHDAGTAAAEVHVSLGYRGFAFADGGGYAARLALVRFPACALTTPRVAACRRPVPLASGNNVLTYHLGANVTLPAGSAPVVLAAVTSPSGGEGDFSASPLSEAGTWAEGGSSGAFTFSYPVNVPPVPGGLAPAVSLEYNSQTVDGLTSATNSQASWVGDGWDYQPGYIERDYQSCEQTSTKTGDLCWSSNDMTTLSLGGVTTRLVDDPKNGWHTQADNGDQITYKTGAHNGTKDGGYWVVTDPDGTSYYFGLNQLPGYATGDPTTGSAWTVPVHATGSGQPCAGSTFAKCDLPLAVEPGLCHRLPQRRRSILLRHPDQLLRLQQHHVLDQHHRQRRLHPGRRPPEDRVRVACGQCVWGDPSRPGGLQDRHRPHRRPHQQRHR
ncbi:MAG TPA: hypothetical protein VGS19_33135 [Streptosporangiaceae bacterium]|nr:hypothetical protein [Streptosporangiaceae bacterium]